MIYDGDFDQTEYLDGDFEERTFCDGDFGEVVIVSDLPEYDGDYTVDPGEEGTVLETAGKKMAQNVVVNPIPSNYGLITQIGANIRVS